MFHVDLRIIIMYLCTTKFTLLFLWREALHVSVTLGELTFTTCYQHNTLCLPFAFSNSTTKNFSLQLLVYVAPVPVVYKCTCRCQIYHTCMAYSEECFCTVCIWAFSDCIDSSLKPLLNFLVNDAIITCTWWFRITVRVYTCPAIVMV